MAAGLALASPAVSSAATRPASTSALAKQYLRDVAPVNRAIATWEKQVGALKPTDTWAKLGKIDQPLAAAIEKLDRQLRGFRATGKVETAIKRLVYADENFVADLVTASGQNLFTGGTWETAVVKDATAMGNAAAAVRRVLGLPPLPR